MQYQLGEKTIKYCELNAWNYPYKTARKSVRPIKNPRSSLPNQEG